MRTLLHVSLAAWMFAGLHVYAQFSNKVNATEFRGRLTEGQDSSYDEYVVDLTSLIDRSQHEQAFVSSDGSFVFRAVAEGDYTARVLTLYGYEVASTVVSVGPASSSSPCEIRLPQQKLEKPVSGTVSVRQLAHPLSRQVRKLLASGQKLIEDEHFGEAAARFREAAQDDPQCSQAHAQLGLALARMKDWDHAIDAYRAANSLDPASSVLHANLSAVLASASRFDEAETEASAALKLDPHNVRAHFVLAGAMLVKHERIQEVVAHLTAAQAAFPSAHNALVDICAQNNVHGCP